MGWHEPWLCFADDNLLDVDSKRKSILAVRTLAKLINDNCGGEFDITMKAIDFCKTAPKAGNALSAAQLNESVERMVSKRDEFFNEGICLDFMTYG